LARRDFTINAMAYRKSEGIIDLYGGQEDLKNKLIRCVGNPHKRFSEDALRIMRGMRFASTLGFRIEEETLSAMLETKNLLQKIAKERITSEFRGVLLGESIYDVLMSCREIIYELIPELRIEDSYIMKKYPDITLWEHTVKSVSMSKNLCERLCMLLHDVAKPSCMVMVDDKEKYPNHAEKGAEIAKEILSRFRFEKIVNTEVLKLIKNHSIRFPKALADMRRFVRDFGYDFTKDWLDIKYSDVFSRPHKESTAQLYYNAVRFFDEIDEKKLCCIISELNISGDDLKKFGIVGKNIGIVLNKLLEDVISENCKNKREVLLKQALLYK
jgi:tRNA nucleotidyltransferase (CCA-adding enzyme)